MKNEKETITEPVEKKAAEKKTHRKSILGRIAKLLFLSIMILVSCVIFAAYFGGYLVNFFQPQKPPKIVKPTPEDRTIGIPAPYPEPPKNHAQPGMWE